MSAIGKISFPRFVIPQNPRVLGLDISTKTGAVICKAVGGKVSVEKHTTLKAPALNGFARLEALELKLKEFLTDPPPDLAVVEGYGFKNRFTLVTLVEIGTMFRRVLRIERGIQVVTMAPKTAKKFATGNGDADKKAMIAAAEQRWGFKTKSDDEADGCALAVAGLAFLGAIKCTLAEKELVSQLSFLSCIPTVS
jgi:crossover junction endodeoxyribonuclease RuvC